MATVTPHQWGCPIDLDAAGLAFPHHTWSVLAEVKQPFAGDLRPREDVYVTDLVYLITEGLAGLSMDGVLMELAPGTEVLVPALTSHKVVALEGGASWLMARRRTAAQQTQPVPAQISLDLSSVTDTSASSNYRFIDDVDGDAEIKEKFQPSIPTVLVVDGRTFPPNPASPGSAGSLAMVSQAANPIARAPRPRRPPVSDEVRQRALDAFHGTPADPLFQCPKRVEQHFYTSFDLVPPEAPYVEMERIVFGGDHNRDLLGAHLGLDRIGGEERVVVQTLTAGGPAHIAGIGLLDQIVSWDGIPIVSFDQFQEVIKGCIPGQVVQVGLLTLPAPGHPHQSLQHIRSVILSHQIAPCDIPANVYNTCAELPKYRAPRGRRM